MCDFVVSTVLLGHPQEQRWPGAGPVHWHENVVIPTKFSSLAVLEVVILTISNEDSDDNVIKMKTYMYTQHTHTHIHTHIYTSITSTITIPVIIIIIINMFLL